jgi:DNA polymerase-1
MTLQVHQTLWPQVQADAGLRFVYERIEMPVAMLAAHRAPWRADRRRRAGAPEPELAERMVALEQEAYEIAGQPFNLGSPSRSARSCSASSACR